MSVERLKSIKETLMCAVEGQIYDLTNVDAEELGEVVDMIKDIEEAIYYCTVVKAMEGEKHPEEEVMYYTPTKGTYSGDWSSGWSGSNGRKNKMKHTQNWDGEEYTEREFPDAFRDERDGKSYKSRRMYMEAKEQKHDKAIQMKELEKYATELTDDILEMIQHTSPEEKQYLSKKMAALANKITQMND